MAWQHTLQISCSGTPDSLSNTTPDARPLLQELDLLADRAGVGSVSRKHPQHCRPNQYPDSNEVHAGGMVGLVFFFFDFLDGLRASALNHQASVLSQPSPAAMGACCLHFGLPLGHFSLT